MPSNSDKRFRPNLDDPKIAHPDVARAVRDAYSLIYDAGDAIKALKAQLDQSLVPLALIGTIDGVNTLFQIASKPAGVRLFLNGILLSIPGDYTYSSGRIIMVVAPPGGSSLICFGGS